MFTPLYTFAKASLYNFVCTAQLLSVSQQLQRNASETLGKIYISVRAKKKFLYLTPSNNISIAQKSI